MIRTLYVLRLTKRHISGQSNVEHEKIKPVALSIVELCLAEGISQLISQNKILEFFKNSVETCWKLGLGLL